MDALINYDWPGNVRELNNAITRGALNAHHDREDISLEALELPDKGNALMFASAHSNDVGNMLFQIWRDQGEEEAVDFFRSLMKRLEKREQSRKVSEPAI